MRYSYGTTQLTSVIFTQDVNRLNSPVPDNQQRKFYWRLKQTKDTLKSPPCLCPPSLHIVCSLHIPTLHKTLVCLHGMCQVNKGFPVWIDHCGSFSLKMERTGSSLLQSVQVFFLWITSNNSYLGFTTHTSMNEARSSCLKGTLPFSISMKGQRRQAVMLTRDISMKIAVGKKRNY